MLQILPVIQNDFYKQGHFKMYPEGTTKIYSNLTPRKSRIPGINHAVLFGTQYFIKEYLIKQWNDNFFTKKWEDISLEYTTIINSTLGPDAISINHVHELHKLGYLPLSIKSLPEGSKVPIRCACLTITNTVDHAYWLVNFLETILSTVTWSPSTVATIAQELKRVLMKYAKETGNEAFVQWQGHDFSMRGMSSLESACVNGGAHLTSFTGTDTIPAIQWLKEYYCADYTKMLVGASVPATEHSIMCMGSQEGELSTFKRLLDLFPRGILSVVSDTWSLMKVVLEILPALKEQILAREGTLTIRPDSFWTDPVDCLCGFDGYHPQMANMGAAEIEVVRKGLIESLWDLFGGTVNIKGYKELDPHIFAIYGDSITIDRATKISERLKEKGFASTNCFYGVGSFSYQFNTRDVLGFAVKATYGVVNGEARNIFKDPITDDGMKKSAKGLLRVDKINGEYVMRDCVSIEEEKGGELLEVFRDSKLLIETTLTEVRHRINEGIDI